MKTRLVVFLFLLVPGRKVIAAPRLILWHPQDTSFNIVLPALESETPREAVQKYVNAMNETPEFRYEMMKGAMVQIPESSFQEFTARKVDPSFLVLANEINQIEGNTYYMNLVVGILRQKQADPFVLPVGADFRLSVADRKKVKLLVNTTFDAELALGGEDADPALYNEPNRYTQPQDIHPLRDRLEADFIRSYLKAGKGVFYAICRGHQLTNASLGSHLIQDLYAENLTETEHRGGTFHTIFIEPDSLMSRMTGGLTEITVNSLHHQAVRDMGTF